MRIYTKTGDDGTTSLFGGQRVLKSDLRIESYGTVDELNSHLGWVVSQHPDPLLTSHITRIQDLLFILGADLATPPDKSVRIDRISEADVALLEGMIDELDGTLPSLKSFILPGGSVTAAGLHIARTVCRRAERLCVATHEEEDLGDAVVHFLNRLSDFLFMLARWENQAAGIPDTPWISR